MQALLYAYTKASPLFEALARADTRSTKLELNVFRARLKQMSEFRLIYTYICFEDGLFWSIHITVYDFT